MDWWEETDFADDFPYRLHASTTFFRSWVDGFKLSTLWGSWVVKGKGSQHILSRWR